MSWRVGMATCWHDDSLTFDSVCCSLWISGCGVWNPRLVLQCCCCCMLTCFLSRWFIFIKTWRKRTFLLTWCMLRCCSVLFCLHYAASCFSVLSASIFWLFFSSSPSLCSDSLSLSKVQTYSHVASITFLHYKSNKCRCWCLNASYTQTPQNVRSRNHKTFKMYLSAQENGSEETIARHMLSVSIAGVADGQCFVASVTSHKMFPHVLFVSSCCSSASTGGRRLCSWSVKHRCERRNTQLFKMFSEKTSS